MISIKISYLVNKKQINYHFYSESEERLKKIIKMNYIKSFILWNIGASYINYIRKNKSLGKFFLSNSYLT